jgi:hypothetical protein
MLYSVRNYSFLLLLAKLLLLGQIRRY